MFWESTPHEWMAAREGHDAYHGVSKSKSKKSKLDAEDIDHLKRMLEENR